MTYDEAVQAYRDFLNDSGGEIQIGGYTYQPSWLLERADQTAFRCGVVDYADSMDIIITD